MPSLNMLNFKFSLLWPIKFLMNVLHVEHALMSARLMQFLKVTFIQLILSFVPIVVHVQKFARLNVFRLTNKIHSDDIKTFLTCSFFESRFFCL